ncbi:MAG TPA: hypothetical protein VIY48_00860, partial [Candidatus Paceibacterota bacterium]
MPKVLRHYKAHFSKREYQKMVLLSFCLLVVSAAVNFYAITFATVHASNSVSDIILSNTPVFDVDGFFVYGTFILAVVGIVIVLRHPKYLPFSFYTIALFWIIRSCFTMMTHMAPFEASYATNFGPSIAHAFFGKDQFFSAHTGMPFVGAIAFWRQPRYRYFFLAATLYFAAVVLAGHLHYTIDVFSAFFITYGIVHIAQWLWPREWALFLAET